MLIRAPAGLVVISASIGPVPSYSLFERPQYIQREDHSASYDSARADE